MDPQRELRFHLNARLPGSILLVTSPFAIVFSLVVVAARDLPTAIMFAAFTTPFALGALDSLTTLVFWRVFQKPILALNATGITYAPPLMPWRSLLVPWDAVTCMYFLHWSSTRLVVYTNHPARYHSLMRQRFSAWWDPEFGGATITVWFGILNVPKVADQQEFSKSIRTIFAPEIAKYGIEVKLAV